MVKEIKCYQDSSGKVHESACDAHRAELVLWLMQGGEMNEASAIKLADRMAEDRSNLSKLIASVCTHCPPRADGAGGMNRRITRERHPELYQKEKGRG